MSNMFIWRYQLSVWIILTVLQCLICFLDTTAQFACEVKLWLTTCQIMEYFAMIKAHSFISLWCSFKDLVVECNKSSQIRGTSGQFCRPRDRMYFLGCLFFFSNSSEVMRMCTTGKLLYFHFDHFPPFELLCIRWQSRTCWNKRAKLSFLE